MRLSTYLFLSRTGFRRNTAYSWSHLLNTLASAVFGFIYISLWTAVAPVTAVGDDPYTQQVMRSMMVLAQVFAWVTTFLPAGLAIQNSVRTGAIALEMSRPVPFFPMILAREAGGLLYGGLFRSLPLALIFGLTVGFPRPGSWSSLLVALPSLALGAYTALLLTYMVGLTALWTTEVRWAHWTYHTLVTLLSGGWIPADLLPGWLGRVAPYLPFASQQYYPIRTYLGLSGVEVLWIQVAWALALTAGVLWLTRQAFRRVVVQGG